ncbi:MAG: alpha-glucan family phosphorylase [Halofilum sp. (in: g-proteobacteria)]|nr:alpha-glucan family phosphorylase [Halofilum sp. (in: g-proteobacteria)]
MAGNRYPLEVQPVVPDALARLHELADNLTYSWDRRIRGLFRRIDSGLWDHSDHNPKVFLRRVTQERLDELVADSDFMAEYNAVLATFDQYHEATAPEVRRVNGLEPGVDLVAYLCMEYGLHESLRLYSGGLGILAGDHCKAAADIGLPFVAVGLMYRQGYFTQTIDADGTQHAHYVPVELADLPVTPVTDASGERISFTVPMPGREVRVQVWQAVVGHTRILLLDTELPANAKDDRAITYQLYGGDNATRIAQEVVLGIGGVRALRALGLAPTAWHVNEGHPAFSILERCREQVAAGLDFDAALEAVAAATVFTTHTPVAAGHDLFDHELVVSHFRDYVGQLGVSPERLLDLGHSPQDHGHFNMTALALRGSRRHNGVSRIHGGIASHMERYLWPDVPPEENPITSITNGVHVPTFLARDWADLFDTHAPGWRSHLVDPGFWREHIEAIGDQRFWSVRQLLKTRLLDYVGRRLTAEYSRRHVSRGRIRSMQHTLTPENTRTLVIGFARRFATYKRALLLFRDPERLARLVGDPQRPVIFLFAGKAHPRDEPGQELIRALVQYADEPAFRDRVFFIESYGMTLARQLVTGVDVWLNTPEYPLEASGTSGQKAAANGVVNVSVLDGWWAEAYDGANGWAIEPHDPDVPADERDAIEADELLDLLEYEVIPSWYADDAAGLPGDWIACAKASMASIVPRFNAERMVLEYTERLYHGAIEHGRRLGADGGRRARELAQWKRRVRERWRSLALHWAEQPPRAARTGEVVRLAVTVNLDGLGVDDVCVECVLDRRYEGIDEAPRIEPFEPVGEAAGEQRYELALDDLPNGLLHFRVRAYPWHADLGHPFEMGLMAWL